MRVIHLARKPLVGSVALNTLEHGTGALNIGGTRVAAGDAPEGRVRHGGGSNQVYAQDEWTKANQATMGSPQPAGRWPANLVLEHLEGCRHEGTKRVKGAGWRDTDLRTTMLRGNKAPKASNSTHHVDADGMETVAAWSCEPGCPAADLDLQSGPSTSAVRRGGKDEHLDPSRESWRFKRAEGGFTDSGGASRFYKQVGGEE